MASMVTTLRGWRIGWRWRAHSQEPEGALEAVGVERAAEMAPVWGRVEVRMPRGRSAGEATGDWSLEQALVSLRIAR